MSNERLIVENLAYWEIIYAVAAWRGYAGWDRDYVGTLQHLAESCINKLIVELEDNIKDILMHRSKPSFKYLLEKYKDKLRSDYDILDRIRKYRVEAVHYSRMPSILVIKDLLINGMEFITRGINSEIKQVELRGILHQ